MQKIIQAKNALEALEKTSSLMQIDQLEQKLKLLEKVPKNLSIAMNVLEVERGGLDLIKQIEKDLLDAKA